MPFHDVHDFTVFRTRLSVLIASSGYTLRALSDKIGITDATLSRYSRGNHIPDIRYVIRMAEFFGVSIDWLLGFHTENSDVIQKEMLDLIDLYSKSSKEDRAVINAVLQKCKEDK